METPRPSLIFKPLEFDGFKIRVIKFFPKTKKSNSLF